MKVQSVLAIALGCGTLLSACGSGSTGTQGSGGSTSNTGGSTTSSGGNTSGGATSKGGASGGAAGGAAGGTSGGSSGGAAGGSGGAGGGASCSNVTACGGDVKGTWTVTGSCLKVSGTLDLTNLGIGCKSADIASGTIQVTGTWTANADGTYADKTSTTGTEKFALAAKCLEISGTTSNCDSIGGVIKSVLAYDSVTCKNAASGGGCDCDAAIKQDGLPGVLSMDASPNGNYEAASNAITIDGSTKYDYCVAGSTMTWTPKPASPTITGTVAFQKGSTGTGGAGGQGGKAAGGSSGNGGAAAGGATGTGGAGGVSARGTGPCDIYAAANTPCAAAYSMIRALSKSYSGPLYQVRSGSSSTNTGTGGTTKDIGMTADGFADTATQDDFCKNTTCTVSLLYDQSGNGNNLGTAKKGNYGCPSDTACADDYESSATKGTLTVGGHKVYSLYMKEHDGYRTAVGLKGKNMPLKADPQGIYELADGTHTGGACCWDFGNVSTDPKAYGVMNTLFFGQAYWGNGAGNPPWFMADFEAGVWAGGSKIGDPGWGGLSDPHPKNPDCPSMAGVPFAFGVLKTSPNEWQLRAANAATATDLATAYKGALPKAMDNLGGIVLGVGGDNSNHSAGTFYEGAIVAGYPTTDTDLAVLKNVQAAGYGK